jgi:hypothetical protein
VNPRNGRKNTNGSPQRVTLPTDLRTMMNWGRAVIGLYHRDPDAGTKALRAVATGPLPQAVSELVNNQSYRGPVTRPIKSINDWAPAMVDVMKWVFGTLTPIAFQTPKGGTPPTGEQRLEQFLGVMPQAAAARRRSHHRGHRRAS